MTAPGAPPLARPSDVFSSRPNVPQMGDSDTATVELSEGEAREIINALSERQTRETGRDEERTLEVRSLLQREFGFEEPEFDDPREVVDEIVAVFDEDTGTHEVQLSRAEAAEIEPALARLESGSEPGEADTIADIRDRLQETFDLRGDER